MKAAMESETCATHENLFEMQFNPQVRALMLNRANTQAYNEVKALM